jgi:hypothetical protein
MSYNKTASITAETINPRVRLVHMHPSFALKAQTIGSVQIIDEVNMYTWFRLKIKTFNYEPRGEIATLAEVILSFYLHYDTSPDNNFY